VLDSCNLTGKIWTMGLLQIALNQDYKSFKSGFHAELEGSLVILSGINGSGKSQLLDVIRGYEYQNINGTIDASITLNNTRLAKTEILYKSFKEFVNIPELTQASYQVLQNARQQIQQQYNDNLLDPSNPNTFQYSESASIAKRLLIEKYGEDRFNSKSISPPEIDKVIKTDFLWKPDDAFTNAIGELFYKYCVKKLHIQAEAGEAGKKADTSSLGTPPWLELNELFKELKLDYRFKDDYRLIETDIDEQPRLYAVSPDGSLNIKQTRPLSSLSDGEKAIISLCFASMEGVKPKQLKLLLLDEYDAALNPSLTQTLYRVIDKYFTSKGITTIYVTHSPASIGLAPQTASFYEVYRPSGNRERILNVSRTNYVELRTLKDFYSEIEDEGSRITEIRKQNTDLKQQVEKLTQEVKKNSDRALVITEGYTDVLLLKAAFKKLNCKLNLDFFDQTDENKRLGSQPLWAKLEHISSITNNRKIIGIFDRDEDEFVKKVGDFLKLGNNVYAFCIPVPKARESHGKISIEFYFTDDEIRSEKSGRRLYFNNEVELVIDEGSGEKYLQQKPAEKISEMNDKKIYEPKKVKDMPTWMHSKGLFAGLVLNDNEYSKNFNFDNFKLIFDQIKKAIEEQ
jgi:ABC-type branched-subunit amino acid transport system ATPase component